MFICIYINTEKEKKENSFFWGTTFSNLKADGVV